MTGNVGSVIGEEDDGRMVEGRAWPEQRRQRFKVNRNELGGVDSRLPALSNDYCNWLADEADTASCEPRPRKGRWNHLEANPRRQIEVRRGEHTNHSWLGQSGTGVDAADLRVSKGRAHERHLQAARRLDIVHVPARPGDEAFVLPAANGMTEDGAGSENRHRWRVPRWDMRIVKSLCFFFGCETAQVSEAAGPGRLAGDWWRR
jgi:hypothetical protein